MESWQLIDVVLRVLKAWTIGDILARDDVRSLRATALSDEADLALDNLACVVAPCEIPEVLAGA